jgi:hypothetical protein
LNTTAPPDGFALIPEIVARANLTIRKCALQSFLDEMVADRIARAARLIGKTTASFATIARQPKRFGDELRRQFRTAWREIPVQVETLKFINRSGGFMDAKKQAIREKSIAKLLLAVSMAELVALLSR